MDESDPGGDRILPVLPALRMNLTINHTVRSVCEIRQLFTEVQVLKRGGSNHGENGLPSEVEKHERHVPSPFCRNH